MFKKIVIINYVLLAVFCVLLNFAQAVQYAPINYNGSEILTGASSQILDNSVEQKLENYIPVESQKQIQKLTDWCAGWWKFLKIIIAVSIFLLFLSLYIERKNLTHLFI